MRLLKCCCSACCLSAEELPTRIIVSGIEISGSWSAISECCWKFTGTGYYAIDGFTAVDKCIPYQEYVRYRECYSRKHVFDFASLPVSDPGLSSTPMQVLRKLKYNVEAIQQGGMRFKIPGARLNVYLTKTRINCSGDSGCKWIVSVEAIADGPGRHIQMAKKFTKYEIVITEIARHPLLDTCLEPIDLEATGTFNTATSGGPCTMPQVGTPPTIRICRKKVSDLRPDSITLEHGDISACGETTCSQQGVDTFVFTGDCLLLGISNCSNPVLTEPAIETVNWGRRYNGSRWEYNRGVGWEVYQPYSCGTPGINDCFVDCRRRYMVATDFGSPVNQLATRYWNTSYTDGDSYCNNVTIDLDAIEVEFEWPA